MEIQELKTLIQETVRETMLEVLKKERLALSLALIPRVSDKEMQEIQEQFGSPSDYDQDDFINMTDWVRNGTKLQ
jgi:protein tyrosine/serine phosphatase